MFGKLLDIALSPITDVTKAIADPFGEKAGEDGKIPPLLRVLTPGASIAQSLVDKIEEKD